MRVCEGVCEREKRNKFYKLDAEAMLGRLLGKSFHPNSKIVF